MTYQIKAAPADMKEIATTQDGRDITRGYLGPLLIPQDTVLRNLNNDLRIYEDVLRDDQVFSTFQQRKLAHTAAPVEVLPGGDSALDKKAADFIKEVVKNIGFDDTTDKMLMGLFLGYSVGECMYAYDGSYVTLDRIKVRKARRFRFDPEHGLRMLTFANMVPGEQMPDKKFWVFSVGADNDDEPYGLGLAHWLYWPTFFKKNGISLWLKFLDKFAQPTAVGKYPHGSEPADINRLLNALQAIHVDSGIAIPEGMQMELLEAARSGTVDYSTMLDKMNEAISKVVLGQIMTSEAAGGHNKAEIQMEVRQDLIKADADVICDSFRKGPVTWLTEWNFPGAKVPLIRRVIEEPEDLKARSERDANLGKIGYRPTLKYIQESYGGEWVDVGLQKDTGAQGNPASAAFAETDALFQDQQQLDDAINKLSPELLNGVSVDAIRPIIKMIASAADYSDVYAKLVEQFPKMDTKQLEDTLARAMFVAEVWGRLSVEDEQG